MASAARTSKLSTLLKREKTLLESLEEVTQRVVRCGTSLDEARHDRQQLDYQIKEARRRTAALERKITQGRAHIRVRVRTLYKLSRGGFVRLLLDEIDGRKMLRRVRAIRQILRRDASEIALYRRELSMLARERTNLEKKRKRHAALERHLKSRQEQLNRARDHQRKGLRRLTRSRRLSRKLVDELNRKERRLMRRIARLAYRVRTAGGFSARRGKLLRPVSGPVVGVFGRTVDRRHKVEVLRRGITFRPKQRARARAAAAGVVRISGPMSGYGNLVLIEHSDSYYSLYGFMGKVNVAVGAVVKRGQVLGHAGIDPLTGNSALYFEIRHQQRPLDPVAWIRSRRAP